MPSRRNQVELNQGDLRSVNIVQASGRSRVVLNLKRPLTHAVSIDGKRILVALGGATDTTTFRPTAAPAAAAATATPAAQPRPQRRKPPRAVPVHCVVSISGAVAEAKAVSSLTCRTRIPMSTSASRANTVCRRLPQHDAAGFAEAPARRMSDFATPVKTT